VIPIFNDEVLRMSTKVMLEQNKKLHKSARPSFKDMNTLIA
jgi:hypothetical protein